MPPNIANGRMHWRKKWKVQRDYYALLDTMQAAGQIPAPPDHPIRRPVLTSLMLCGARHDHDNAVARHKWCLDWLATRGYIVNDKHLDWHSFPEQDVKRRERYEIHLTLWERAA